jgi:hypothetical protein
MNQRLSREGARGCAWLQMPVIKVYSPEGGNLAAEVMGANP